MIAAARLDDHEILPDTDFEGVQVGQYSNGLECLENTGCVSIVGAVRPYRIWTFNKKQTRELFEEEFSKISTGVVHHALKARHDAMQEYHLGRAKRLSCGPQGWR